MDDKQKSTQLNNQYIEFIVFIFGTIAVLLIIGFTYSLYKYYLTRKSNTRPQAERRNTDLVYSQLATRNEFDLNCIDQ